jgi:DNA-binding MarR family transcriptional regulator
VSFVLWQAQHLTELAMEQALAPLELSPSQVALLLLLKQEPALSGAELARRLHLTPQTVATSVGQLEKRGLVTRRAHAVHRKLIEVFVSDQGLTMLRRAVETMQQVDARATAGLTPAAREALAASLRTIIGNFGGQTSQG